MGALACLNAADAFLAKQPASPLIQRERLTLSVTRQALVRSPVSVPGGEQGDAVMASSRGIKRLPLTDAERTLIEQLPARVASTVKRLLERGWFAYARNELMAGRNPGTKGWMRVTCAKLLQGPVTRPALQLAYQQELDLGASSAKVQASIAIAVLKAGRIVRETARGAEFTPD